MQPVRQIKISLYVEPLPDTVHGMICPTKDGKPDSYIIAVNSKDPEERQRTAFLHECTHIWNRDLEKQDGKVGELETQAHKQMEEYEKSSKDHTLNQSSKLQTIREAENCMIS